MKRIDKIAKTAQEKAEHRTSDSFQSGFVEGTINTIGNLLAMLEEQVESESKTQVDPKFLNGIKSAVTTVKQYHNRLQEDAF